MTDINFFNLKIIVKLGTNYTNNNQVNSSSGNPDGSNELMDQDHEQTN